MSILTVREKEEARRSGIGSMSPEFYLQGDITNALCLTNSERQRRSFALCFLGHGSLASTDKRHGAERFPRSDGYYGKFVQNYGIITKPLTQLLTKKGFDWTPQTTAAFEHLKLAMTHTPVLALPDFSRPFCSRDRCM